MGVAAMPLRAVELLSSADTDFELGVFLLLITPPVWRFTKHASTTLMNKSDAVTHVQLGK